MLFLVFVQMDYARIDVVTNVQLIMPPLQVLGMGHHAWGPIYIVQSDKQDRRARGQWFRVTNYPRVTN